MSIDEFDTKQIWRCPVLGGEVPFLHCRKTNSTLPCQRIVDCWGGKIDIVKFLKDNYSVEDLEKALAASGGRVATIFETVEKFSD